MPNNILLLMIGSKEDEVVMWTLPKANVQERMNADQSNDVLLGKFSSPFRSITIMLNPIVFEFISDFRNKRIIYK